MSRQFPIEPFETLNELFVDMESVEPIEDLLSNTVKLAVRGVQCDAGSLSLEQEGQLRTVVATDEDVVKADRAQYEAGHGPCVEAADGGEIHLIPDMSQDHRWEKFSNTSMELGWRSSLSLPLRVEDRTIGALNLYARTTNAFDEESKQIASLFASRAALGLAHVELALRSKTLIEQLRTAVESRDVIGQAKGILMEREGVDSDRAFQMLMTASQHSNTKLREVAQELVRRASGDADAKE